MRRAIGASAIGLALLTGCTTGSQPAVSPSPLTSPPTATPTDTRSPTATPSTSPSAEASSPTATPARFDAVAAMADVRALAGRIGPRLATSAAYREAARLVERRFRQLGYDANRQPFPVPAGDSWGVPVQAGRSTNVVATPRGFEPTRPHVIVGAHLDTVAVAPGAEDNASGVSVMLELVRLAGLVGTRSPTVFIAFGAEEPRGTGDDMHHFGSRDYVRMMGRRDALRGMVSLDRVGVGSSVPVCTGPISPADVQDRLVRLADRADIPAHRCENTASDHWSFEKAGFPVARLGSTPYAAYHSRADRPHVVDPRQLDRTGRLAWAWLTA